MVLPMDMRITSSKLSGNTACPNPLLPAPHSNLLNKDMLFTELRGNTEQLAWGAECNVAQKVIPVPTLPINLHDYSW